MPRKPVNAFYFYMKELEPQLRREGRVFPRGLADVVPIAHPRWTALPVEEKQRFENMVKMHKKRMRGIEGDNYKFDNVGNIIAHRKDPFEETEKRRLQEREEVKAKWPSGKELINEDFYIIHFNTLCKTDTGVCLPCEVGLVEFSLSSGIKKVYHKFIDPGAIPSGYRYTCNEKSESTHQIPVQNFELADKEHRGLYIQLENFVNQDGYKESYPPVYCQGKTIDEVEMCLAWIDAHAEMGRPLRINKVYEVEGLIVDLYAHIGRDMSKSMVFDMLSTNIHDYNSQVQCKWHAEKDVKYCSLGITRRQTYVILDNLADVYEFKLTKNHLPERSNITDTISIIYQPKLDLPKQRHSTSASSCPTPRSFSSANSSLRSSPIPGSDRYPSRDYRYSTSASVDDQNDDDTLSDRLTNQSLDSRSTTPQSGGVVSRGASSVQSPRNLTQSSMSGRTDWSAGTGRGSVSSTRTVPAPWLRGSTPMVGGVGRGMPVASKAGAVPRVRFPPAPPGMGIKSVFPLPRPEGMPVQCGRGFAPEKSVD